MTDFLIHNIARARHNRAQRSALPQNPRMKQYVGEQQQRVVRGQPILVSKEMVERNLAEIRAKQAAHMIELRTRDGRLVDLATLEPGPFAPQEPKPHPRLDSVANDKNFPTPPGWTFVPPYRSDDATMPQVLSPGEKPALLQDMVVEPASADPATEAPATTEPAVEPAADVVSHDAAAEDQDLEAALMAAQADATEGDGAGEDVASGEAQKKGKRNRR
jgi:hypothetical protein